MHAAARPCPLKVFSRYLDQWCGRKRNLLVHLPSSHLYNAVGVTSSCRLKPLNPLILHVLSIVDTYFGWLQWLTHSTSTPESDTPDEKCGKYQMNLDAASSVCKHSTTHSLGAEAFLKQKLELLQDKLHSGAAVSMTDDIVTNTRIQASSLECMKESDTQENAYIVASSCRLRGGHAACVREHSSASYGSQKRVHGNAEVFSRQCEILRIESLMNRMKKDIKRVANEAKEHNQVVTSPQCRDLLHDLAENEFVSHKLKLLTQTDFGDNLDSHLYLRNTVSLLGDIVGSCVAPSTPSSDIWKALKALKDKLATGTSK